MNPSETKIWLSLADLKEKLNGMVKKSGDAFLKKLEEARPEESMDTSAMEFMPVKATFKDTFAGLGDYFYVVNVKYKTRIYRAEFAQDRKMNLIAFPGAVNDLTWIKLEGLKTVLNSIAEGSGENIETRLEKALPDDLVSSINGMEFMLISASSSGSDRYCFEVRIKDTTSDNPDLAMELTEFSFKIWQSSGL